METCMKSKIRELIPAGKHILAFQFREAMRERRVWTMRHFRTCASEELHFCSPIERGGRGFRQFCTPKRIHPRSSAAGRILEKAEEDLQKMRT